MRTIPALARALPALVLLLLLLPGTVWGQQIRSPYAFIDTRHEAGILAGMAFENRGQFDLGPGGGPMLAGRYAIKLGGAFGLEATGSLLSTDRRVIDPRPDEGLVVLGETDALVGAAEGRLRFSPVGARTWNGLAPYLAAGGGLAVDFFGRSSLEEELDGDARFSFGPSFVGSLGGGVRWLPGDRLSFRAESAFHIWKLGTPRAYFDLEQELGPVPEQEWTAVGTILLGGSLRF
jgi:hypothetical protein